jgi:lysophospholipase L1-like esterase
VLFADAALGQPLSFVRKGEGEFWVEASADDFRTIVQTIRGFNGSPILITPPNPRLFDDKGKVISRYEDRSAVVKDVASELQTPLIDLNQLTRDLYTKLGESGSCYIPWNATDLLHYSTLGAQVIAGLVVNALPDNFGPYLIGIFNPRPKP